MVSHRGNSQHDGDAVEGLTALGYSEREARELADSLRKSVLRPSVANPLRRRGVAMIKQVYLRDNDKDALLSFAQDEVSSLHEALMEAAAGRPVSVP